ncbi:hypothetical protein CU002_2614 [Enterococcus faecium]|nr:hypothetical protein [Enterococcus faecium]
MKKVLAIFGTKLTKATFAKGVSKVIPVVGGVLSGSMNYMTLKPMANRLKDELGKSVNYTQQDIKILGATIFGVDRQLAYQLLFLYHFYI